MTKLEASLHVAEGSANSYMMCFLLYKNERERGGHAGREKGGRREKHR